MKSTLYILAGVLLLSTSSCQKDSPKEPGNPTMEIVSAQSQGHFGGSIPFSITAGDPSVPLSTLRAELYYGEEKASETVIRTKESGKTYTGKLFAPYYKNVPDGTATVIYTLQNIHFTKQSEEKPLALTRPKFPYLTLVMADGTEHKMTPKGNDLYSVTAEFANKVKAYIKAPAVAPNGNPLTFGWEGGGVTDGNTNLIPFSSFSSGRYAISFNTKSYEAAPFVNIRLNGQDMTLVSDDVYALTLSLKPEDKITLEGFQDLDSWYVDVDYFSRDGDALKFLPLAGDYKVVADFGSKTIHAGLQVDGKDATMTSDGRGVIYLMGWGVGSPSMDKQFGWNPGAAYPVAEIAPHVFQFTGNAGPEKNSAVGDRFRFDYLDFKFFFQNGWGGEFAGDNELSLAPGTEKFLKPGGNLNLADGVKLEEGKRYRVTIDLTKGVSKGTVKMEEL